MKLIAPIVLFGATARAFNFDLDHEDTLVRVRRSDDTECSYLFGGFTYYLAGDQSVCDAAQREDELEYDSIECEDNDAALPGESIDDCVARLQLARNSRSGRKLGIRYTRWKAVTKMIAHIVAKPSLSKKQVVKKLLNYGCHCFPGTKKLRSVGGKGPAMDTLDSLCRGQYQCHKCVELETGCNPDETPYKAQFKGKKKSLFKEVICRDEVGTCARSMCDCDKAMAENLDAVWFEPNMHNTFYWGEKKNKKRNPYFDYAGTCSNTGLTEKPNTCCGVFPDVIPFNAATKDCCVVDEGPKLFDPMTHTCCAGGLIKTTGSC